MWKDNDIHYKGRFDFSNGNYYRGKCSSLLYLLNNINILLFIGQFDRNTKQGKGIFTWASKLKKNS